MTMSKTYMKKKKSNYFIFFLGPLKVEMKISLDFLLWRQICSKIIHVLSFRGTENTISSISSNIILPHGKISKYFKIPIILFPIATR